MMDPTNGIDSIISPPVQDVAVLREWLEHEGCRTASDVNDLLNQQRVCVLRKLTVAFAIGKLIQHLKLSLSNYSQDELARMCSVDNFVVHASADEVFAIDMISPSASLNVTSNCFDKSNFFTSRDSEEHLGGDVKTFMTRHSPFCCAKTAEEDNDGGNNEISLCYAFGVLLHFIFLGEFSTFDISTNPANPQEIHSHVGELLRSLSISPTRTHSYTKESASNEASRDFAAAELARPIKHVRKSSQNQDSQPILSGQLSFIVRDLLIGTTEDDGNRSKTFAFLDAVLDDMHMLLLQPNRLLFDINHQLKVTTAMYGRTAEAKALTNAFCRSSTSGHSEAFTITGFSGSGKTRLVQSIFESVIAANGLLLTKKFEEHSTNQLSLVLSSFNDACALLAEESSDTDYLWRKLLSEFGTNFYKLVQILPNVIRLAPTPEAAQSTSRLAQGIINGGDVNFFSLCDIIKRFMRAISISSRPFVLFLDDLQWADSVSLGLVHTVLSDIKGSSCMFFIGGYREYELSENHVLHGFFQWLSNFNVPLNTVHLDGMSEEDVNSLVSDTLGMLPRLCQRLSQIVFRKTKGNPFFVATFLRSLVDKNLLTYSISERSWVWDIDDICAEHITPNVLDLLSAKLANLSENIQTALKVASCFGIEVEVSIVKELSRSQQYSTLFEDLNNAVKEGLMDLDADRSHFRFAHDKVRETAFEMIRSEDKNETHFNIGMALLSNLEQMSNLEETQDIGDTLFVILGQINRGISASPNDITQRLSIAKLNHNAASQMLQSYNYTSAYVFSKTAISLLPNNAWSLHYDLSTKLYFLLSKAAYSYKKVDEAKDALNMILEHAKSLQTKLDAYALLHSILLNACAPNEMDQLLITMTSILRTLGEDIPNDAPEERIAIQVDLAAEQFNETSDDSLLDTSKSISEHEMAVMQAYNTLVYLAYVARPKLFPYYVTCWARFHLDHKVNCEYTPAVYVTFATVLCRAMSTKSFLGHRIGKLGLRLLNQYDLSTSHLPLVYLMYYGFVGILFEPLQACIDMHRKAYEISLQAGKPSIAAVHKQFLIARELHAGTSLQNLKEEIQIELKMSDHIYSLPHLGMKLLTYNEAVLALIGEAKSNNFEELEVESSFDKEMAYVQTKMVSLTFLGFYDRARHIFNKWEEENGEDESNKIMSFRGACIYFYYGLSAIGLHRKKSKAKRNRKINNKWLKVLQNAAAYSSWNFKNKASLLLAEKLSLELKNDEAEVQYGIAIESAKSSKFIHEQGLACELAGMHYERQGKSRMARSLFTQAESCYEVWGSIVKTRQMKEKIDNLTDL